MNAPDPHQPPPPPPWLTAWHAPIQDRDEPVERPPPVPMTIAIATAALALGLILGRMF